jgi:hypothetical protein
VIAASRVSSCERRGGLLRGGVRRRSVDDHGLLALAREAQELEAVEQVGEPVRGDDDVDRVGAVSLVGGDEQARERGARIGEAQLRADRRLALGAQLRRDGRERRAVGGKLPLHRRGALLDERDAAAELADHLLEAADAPAQLLRVRVRAGELRADRADGLCGGRAREREQQRRAERGGVSMCARRGHGGGGWGARVSARHNSCICRRFSAPRVAVLAWRRSPAQLV